MNALIILAALLLICFGTAAALCLVAVVCCPNEWEDS